MTPWRMNSHSVTSPMPWKPCPLSLLPSSTPSFSAPSSCWYWRQWRHYFYTLSNVMAFSRCAVEATAQFLCIGRGRKPTAGSLRTILVFQIPNWAFWIYRLSRSSVWVYQIYRWRFLLVVIRDIVPVSETFHWFHTILRQNLKFRFRAFQKQKFNIYPVASLGPYI